MPFRPRYLILPRFFFSCMLDRSFYHLVHDKKYSQKVKVNTNSLLYYWYLNKYFCTIWTKLICMLNYPASLKLPNNHRCQKDLFFCLCNSWRICLFCLQHQAVQSPWGNKSLFWKKSALDEWFRAQGILRLEKNNNYRHCYPGLPVCTFSFQNPCFSFLKFHYLYCLNIL